MILQSPCKPPCTPDCCKVFCDHGLVKSDLRISVKVKEEKGTPNTAPYSTGQSCAGAAASVPSGDISNPSRTLCDAVPVTLCRSPRNPSLIPTLRVTSYKPQTAGSQVTNSVVARDQRHDGPTTCTKLSPCAKSSMNTRSAQFANQMVIWCQGFPLPQR